MDLGRDELRRHGLLVWARDWTTRALSAPPHTRAEHSESNSEGDRSMNLKPLGDRVVVEREEAKEKTAGGIVLPDTAKDKPQKGKVLAVGEGRLTKDGKRRELQVKVGDQVLFTSYAGDEFKLDSEKKVLLMREDDILAVLASARARAPGPTRSPGGAARRGRSLIDPIPVSIPILGEREEGIPWLPRWSRSVGSRVRRCGAGWPCWPARSR